ncbi:hypothetical protein BC941DRAFT_469038 [Chlamydoabsidia padenii]|nr:hypothetical protein BC941DRAFT_469038 [Chlamydoabsidia padenii]
MTLNITHVTRNPVVCSSVIVVTVGWFLLLVGSFVSGFKGLVWWVIAYEAILTVGILYILMKSAFPDYRLLILTCLAISITLLTQIIDTHLHIGLGSAKAAAGGGIMMIVMQFFWVLVFGSTPGSWIYGAVYGLPASMTYLDKENTMLISPSYSVSQHDSIHSNLTFSPSQLVSFTDQQIQPQQQQQYQVYVSPTTQPDATNPSNNNAMALHPCKYRQS